MRTPLALAACVLTCSAFAQPGSTPTTPAPAAQPDKPAQPLTTPGVAVPDGPVVQKSEIDGILIEDLKIGSGYEVKPGGAVVANGQGDMKGKLFRIAHIGYYDYLDTVGILAALEQVLATVTDKPVEFGSAVEAAQRVFAASRNRQEAEVAGARS